MRNLFLFLLLICITLLVISCSEEPKKEKSNIPSTGAKTIGDQSWKDNDITYMERCRLKKIIKDEEFGGYSCVYQGQKKDQPPVYVSVGEHHMCVKAIYCGRK
tara:strand:- start:388 stop:696 length:309 start_codon:yes stop_codon:yes gene_type:complete